MIDFEQAKNKAFEAVSLTCAVSVLDYSTKKRLKLQRYNEVWLVETEVFLLNDLAKTIRLLICLPHDFPLIVPKIHLSKEDYEWIKYIPHIDDDTSICLFDEETVRVDPKMPAEIVLACIEKSKKIIELGLKKINSEDFDEEFISYWKLTYTAQDMVFSSLNMLSSLPNPSTHLLPIIFLPNAYKQYNYILHDGGENVTSFIAFLKEKDIAMEDQEAFYLGQASIDTPPFGFTNESLLQIVNNDFPLLFKAFKQYINKNKVRVVIFSKLIKGQILYFGFILQNLLTKRKGFTKNSLSPFQVFSQMQKTSTVLRITFDTYTPERLQQRTDRNNLNSQPLAFAIAGLGSIGSNFVPYVCSLGPKSIDLVDPDVLTLENINRHLLGFNDILRHKVEGVKDYLLNKDPLMKVSVHKSSIINIIRNKLQVINQSDYLIVAVGKENIESFILDYLEISVISKPVIFLWVEPYLQGGHCLLINPGSHLTMQSIKDNDFYKFNVISQQEYLDQKRVLTFKEAGCQASYVPYGQQNITLFLSCITPLIFNFMQHKNRKNYALTWRSGGEIKEQINLQLSPFGQRILPGQVLTTEL